VEVAVGAFFNGKQFIYPVNINFEHKKLFPGNLGPPTGEMGTSMFWSPPNQLFNQTLLKMESKLAEEGYVGYIDVNCIVNGNGIYPLEFTARFLIVVGLGQTMKQAQSQVYSRIKNVMIPNMYYRTDIGDRWDEDSDRLHNWGILR
jgi:phosphoribosylamine-glycine ligase